MLIIFILTIKISVAGSDESDIVIIMTEPKTCIPGSFDVRGNVIYQCIQNGTDYELFLKCESDTTHPIIMENIFVSPQ